MSRNTAVPAAFPKLIVGAEYMCAKGPIVTDDFVDMEASACVEVGATLFGPQVGAAQLY